MAGVEPIDNVDELPGETIFDQLGNKVGQVKDVYKQDGDPMWVTVEASTGIATKRLVFIPVARLKREDDQIRVPYTVQHLNKSPEIEASDDLSEEDDFALRAYYSVGVGDGELRDENEKSYASRVPDGEGPVSKDSG